MTTHGVLLNFKLKAEIELFNIASKTNRPRADLTILGCFHITEQNMKDFKEKMIL